MNEDWQESSEGELAPDLTEEAGYAGWDPPARAWLRPLVVALSLTVVAAFVGGMLLVLR